MKYKPKKKKSHCTHNSEHLVLDVSGPWHRNMVNPRSMSAQKICIIQIQPQKKHQNLGQRSATNWNEYAWNKGPRQSRFLAVGRLCVQTSSCNMSVQVWKGLYTWRAPIHRVRNQLHLYEKKEFVTPPLMSMIVLITSNVKSALHPSCHIT